ncbi:MAG TPA: hypothetical protein VKV06_15450 [Acidimicrobiales bacterium]|nr:hypothetical protein [Acidimicrobiales bacterium]
MNPETIDSEFAKLQQEIDQSGQAIQTFAAKLQAAANAGDANAREWLLDLKSIALQVQQEQLQTQAVLQALHDFTVNHLSADPEGYRGQQQYQQPQYQQPPAYAPQPQYGYQQGGAGGMLQRFMGGGFGRAIITGAGFGIGDDIINSIF